MRWASGKYNRAFFGVDTADAAATAFETWSDTTARHRADLLLAAHRD